VSDVAAAAASSAPPSSGPLGFSLWSHGSFSFKDLLDIVNPLQHLPIIGSIYRYLTGDEPAGGTRIIGDGLYGGPIGFGVSVVTTALFTDSNGRDLGERLLAGVFGPRDQGSPTLGTPMVATADGQPATPAPAAQLATTPASQKPLSYVHLPTSVSAAAAATQPVLASAQPLTQTATGEPVALNQLFRSLPPTAPAATPEQRFLAQSAQFQRQVSNGRGTNGAVLNDHPVPLELSSNLMPVLPPGARPVTPAQRQAAVPNPGPAQAAVPGAAASTPAPADPNPIAQKMLDALAKYEQLKKQEDQSDSSTPPVPPKVDLSL